MTSTTANSSDGRSVGDASVPSLPPLYFQGKNAAAAPPPPASHPTAAAASSDILSLPPELAQRCLSGFCDWGDLARLSAVRSSWSGLVRDAADAGGRDAKWELAGAMLEGTRGMGRNPAKAIEYLRGLAGVTLRENEENDMEDHENDEEDTENDEEDKKDEADDEVVFAPAMRKLATCYLTGDGADKDTAHGLRWLKAAYRHGKDIDAAHELAVIYEYGEHDVKIDVVAAAEWFRIAAEGGHVEAMAEYALCCELGCGREQSDDDALDWYMKAAEAGHVTSKFSVAEAYEEARGVPQSDEEACLWYYKAAVEGDEDSKRALRRLRDIARIVLPGWEGVLDA